MANGMTKPTCADNAEKALAYDVTVGICTISNKQLQTLRIAADWRLLADLPDGNEQKQFKEYFVDGKYKGLLLSKWGSDQNCAAKMPEKIMDERQNQRPQVNHSDFILRTDGA